MHTMPMSGIETFPQPDRGSPARWQFIPVFGFTCGVGKVSGRQTLKPDFQGVDEQTLAKTSGARQELVCIAECGFNTGYNFAFRDPQQLPKPWRLVHIEPPGPANAGKGRLVGVQGGEVVHGERLCHVQEAEFLYGAVSVSVTLAPVVWTLFEVRFSVAIPSAGPSAVRGWQKATTQPWPVCPDLPSPTNTSF